MLSEIRARIGTARLLLERVAGHPTAHAESSRLQAIALIDAAHRCKDMEGMEATLGELAQQVQWSVDDATQVASAVTSSSASGSVHNTRSPLQDFQHVHHYVLDSEWVHMQSSSSTMTTRLDMIINRMLRLGCRCPTELLWKQ